MGNHWAKRHMYMLAQNINRRGRPVGAKTKTTVDVREAIAKLSRDNVGKLSKWISQVAEEDPAKACDILLRAIEYHIPKQRSVEVTGGATINILAVLARAQQTGLDGLLAQSEPNYIEHDPARFAEAEAAYRERALAELDKPFDPLAFEPESGE
jgi:hypothetical protein